MVYCRLGARTWGRRGGAAMKNVTIGAKTFAVSALILACLMLAAGILTLGGPRRSLRPDGGARGTGHRSGNLPSPGAARLPGLEVADRSGGGAGLSGRPHGGGDHRLHRHRRGLLRGAERGAGPGSRRGFPGPALPGPEVPPAGGGVPLRDAPGIPHGGLRGIRAPGARGRGPGGLLRVGRADGPGDERTGRRVRILRRGIQSLLHRHGPAPGRGSRLLRRALPGPGAGLLLRALRPLPGAVRPPPGAPGRRRASRSRRRCRCGGPRESPGPAEPDLSPASLQGAKVFGWSMAALWPWSWR
ncbi:MAG: hypothetical protein MZV70_22160 [Desulfobacterales bacterium]|nr:hypothetical protein [Desulfobacterales bacterium]